MDYIALTNLVMKDFLYILILFVLVWKVWYISKVWNKRYGWFEIKSLFEKSNTFQAFLNTYYRALSDLQSCGSLGPPSMAKAPRKLLQKVRVKLTPSPCKRDQCTHESTVTFRAFQCHRNFSVTQWFCKYPIYCDSYTTKNHTK